ncbi:hypothetical protein D4F06_17470 [Salmonella enterica subsp. enterica serovar Muenchen]|nr:hypothetical protein [Salmonella enterica subsp. enterica serovar Muenchen]EBY3556089.1 hypothetical protein [Salmonella enterica subsp. enterica serovar Muenchen]ECJ4482615.1 hypothetical protein [Salmonella enterica subsp. diarizonae]ECZ0254613.1 hypothetical protein [Salmonella enterica subsp. diarizonae]HAG2580959.1 hypothetical protein [Salmonella enterica]
MIFISDFAGGIAMMFRRINISYGLIAVLVLLTLIAVSEMDRVTQQNASLVEESAAATGALTEQTNRLTQLASLFRTERSSAGV